MKNIFYDDQGLNREKQGQSKFYGNMKKAPRVLSQPSGQKADLKIIISILNQLL